MQKATYRPAAHKRHVCTGKPSDDAEAYWRIKQHAANGDNWLSNHVPSSRSSRSHRRTAQGRPSTAGTATTASASEFTQRSESAPPPHRLPGGQEMTSPSTAGELPAQRQCWELGANVLWETPFVLRCLHVCMLPVNGNDSELCQYVICTMAQTHKPFTSRYFNTLGQLVLQKRCSCVLQERVMKTLRMGCSAKLTAVLDSAPC